MKLKRLTLTHVRAFTQVEFEFQPGMNLTERDKAERFPHFCFVITYAAQELLQKAERERRRKQFSRSQTRQ